MALLLRRRIHRGHRILLARAFSSSSSGDGKFAATDQRTTKFSPFAEIRDHLKPTPLSSPPRPGANSPPPLPPSPPPPAVPALDDVRRSLHLFRNPQPSSGETSASSNPTPSFVEILRARPAPPTGRATGADAFPFSALRESFNKKLGTNPAAGPLPGAANPMDWSSILSSRQRQDGKPLPESVFGREMRGKAGRGRDGKVEEQQFIRLYSYDEFGKRLSELWPARTGRSGSRWRS